MNITQTPHPIGPMPRVVRLDDHSEWIGFFIVAAMALGLLAALGRRITR